MPVVKRQLNVRDIAENATLRPIHLAILAICFFTAVVDGLDNQAIGFSAPAISADLAIPVSRFGLIFSAGLIGTLVGAVMMGRLADRFGRRRILISCTVLFAILTAATPIARNVWEFSVVRFLGGVGLGGAMPCFLTLVAEFAPKSRKALATGIIWCGYPTGGVVGGLIGSQILSRDGWQEVFYIGGGVAALAAVLQWWSLPESMQYLALSGRHSEELRRTAGRLAPDMDDEVVLVAERVIGNRAGMGEVFAEGRTASTILLWIPIFMTFTITTCTVLWLPGLFKAAGMPVGTAALMLAIGNFATLPSQVASGYLLDRIGPFRVLPIAYGALALSFVGLAATLKIIPAVAAAMITIGFLQGPGIAGMLFLATTIYPPEIRSTGVGLAMGVGRSGQVVASLVVGAMIAGGLTPSVTIRSMAAAPVIALVCVILLGVSLRNRGRAQTARTLQAAE